MPESIGCRFFFNGFRIKLFLLRQVKKCATVIDNGDYKAAEVSLPETGPEGGALFPLRGQ